MEEKKTKYQSGEAYIDKNLFKCSDTKEMVIVEDAAYNAVTYAKKDVAEFFLDMCHNGATIEEVKSVCEEIMDF